jgi:hypothetical protein
MLIIVIYYIFDDFLNILNELIPEIQIDYVEFYDILCVAAWYANLIIQSNHIS